MRLVRGARVRLLLAGMLAVTALTAAAVEWRAQQEPPIPTPAAGTFFGLSVPGDDQDLLDRAATAAGARPGVDNFFLKLDSPRFDVRRLRQVAGHGMRPMVSLEPWSYRDSRGQTDLPAYRLSAIATGGQDEALRRIARVTADYGSPVLLRFAHEMNGWWYPWAVGQNGNTAADYVAAWRHVHDLFRAAGAGNARFVWSPNVLTGSSRESGLTDAYPGDEYVDLVGMTGYGRGSSADATLTATYERLATLTGRDVVLAETGADGPDKAAWIASLGPWLRDRPRVVGFVWFETTPASTGATGDYRFTQTPGSLQAFRALVAGLPRRP